MHKDYSCHILYYRWRSSHLHLLWPKIGNPDDIEPTILLFKIILSIENLKCNYCQDKKNELILQDLLVL